MATAKTVGGSVAGIVAAIAVATPFIMQREGLTLTAKPDVGDYAICYGHDGAVRGEHLTVSQCQVLLNADIKTATNSILIITPKLATHTNQLAATIDFVYNVGVGAYQDGSVARDFKVGNYKAGCSAMLLYDNVDGKFNQGLYNRRKLDYTLCMKGL
jgi:lysozyme